MTAQRATVGAALGGSRAVLGIFALIAPESAVRACAGPNLSAMPPPWVVRLLGGRLLLQGALEVGRPSRTVLLVGAGVDATHALSMLVIAAASRYRRPALVSAGIAAGSAGLATAAAAAAQRGHRR